MTQLFNNKYFQTVVSENEESALYKYLTLISLHNFAPFNTLHGWEAGDRLLGDIGAILQRHLPTHIVCRLYADNFVILSSEKTILKEEFFTQLKEILPDEVGYTLDLLNLEQENSASINLLLRKSKGQHLSR